VQIDYKFMFFWPKFNQKSNFFIDAFEAILRESKQKGESDLGKLQIELHSVFGWPRKLNPLKRIFRQLLVGAKRILLGKNIVLIWYSGEFGKVPKGYDLTLSYSPTLGKNVYLPVWAIYATDIATPKKYDRDFMFTWNQIMRKRPLRSFENNKMACTFISNPTKKRLDFAKELELMGILDIFGAVVGKSVVNKKEIASKYIFQLCLENEDSDNYVTEKPLEAWMCENIPIYMMNGTLSPLNTKAIVNIREYDAQQLSRILEDIVRNESRLNRIYCEPIMASRLDSEELKSKFMDVVSKRTNGGISP
jgi:hypothetical protein